MFSPIYGILDVNHSANSQNAVTVVMTIANLLSWSMRLVLRLPFHMLRPHYPQKPLQCSSEASHILHCDGYAFHFNDDMYDHL